MNAMDQPVAPSIKSRPVYREVSSLESSGEYLFVVEPCGLENLSSLLRNHEHQRARILLSHAADDASNRGLNSGPDADQKPVDEDIWQQFEAKLLEALNESTVSCRLVVIGSEAFLWDVRGVAVAQGLVDEEILLYPIAGRGRRVFCAHCRTFTEGVHASPVACTGCGWHLEVRDHFSRRLGAYMGVRIDAEEPGVVPQQEELN